MVFMSALFSMPFSNLHARGAPPLPSAAAQSFCGLQRRIHISGRLRIFSSAFLLLMILAAPAPTKEIPSSGPTGNRQTSEPESPASPYDTADNEAPRQSGRNLPRPTLGLVFAILMASALLAAAIAYALNRSLRHLVRQRTAELRDELEERKRIEQELTKSEERLSRFFEAAFEGIFFHMEGTIVDINPAITEILGYAPEDAYGRSIMEFIVPESRQWLAERMEAGDTGPYEVTGIHGNGSLIPLEIRARSIDMGGVRARVVGFHDISRLKQVENELRRYQDELLARTESLEAIRSISDRLYRSLDLPTIARCAVTSMMLRAGSPSVAIFLLDEKGEYLQMLFSQGFGKPVNEAAERIPVRGSLSGLAVEKRGVVVSMDVAGDDRLEPTVRQSLMTHGYNGAVSVPLLAEERVLGVLNLLYGACPLLSPMAEQELLIIGRTIGLAVSHALNVDHLRNEMAERRKTEEALQRLNAGLEQRVIERTAELARAKERAEESDRMKSAFLAAMSHELRTPLNSIIGFTGILRQELAGPLNPEQKKQMDMVRNSSRHLLALINDVLDLTKIEAGRLALANRAFDLRASVEKVVKTLRPLMDTKGLDLFLEMEPECLTVVSDQRRVEQVLLNLLGNAIKFTDKGRIGVKCRLQENTAHVSISDTGIGIPAEELKNLFKPFLQLESGLARRYEGTGLGLSICKSLLENMGGEIWVESAVGKGSTFSFSLPATGGR